VPTLHRLLRRWFIALFARAVLFLFGLIWIPVEIVPRKRGRLALKSDWAPTAGDIIVSNWVSWIELLWLAFRLDLLYCYVLWSSVLLRRFDPQFVLPVTDVPDAAVVEDSTPISSTPGRRTGTGSAAISSTALRKPTYKATIRGWIKVPLLTMLRQTGSVPPYGSILSASHNSPTNSYTARSGHTASIT
jgi:hypothetical protein